MSWFGLVFMLFVIISLAIIKRATLVQQAYGEKLKTLNSYAKLITLARQETWKATELQQLIDRLNIDGHSPAEALMQLSKELDRLDLRNNQLLYVILEGSIFFQLRQVVRIKRWKPSDEMAGNCRRTGCSLFIGYFCIQSSGIHLSFYFKQTFPVCGNGYGTSTDACGPMCEK